MNHAAAIIVAGGSGVRFGGPVRKQYVRLLGQPILRWSLKAFERNVQSLVVVVPAEDCSSIRRTLSRWSLRCSVSVVPGGKTRADSVRAGLRALDAPAKWIAVHDAVRPLIRSEQIEVIFKAAVRSGAAIAACLSHDTVKLADAHACIRETPDRTRVWLAQTPQIFERHLLERAHRQGQHLTATDDAFLVERLGVRVSLIDTSPENIKVTRPLDLVVARHVLSQRRKNTKGKRP